jgi:signal transduction histidine kinase
MAREVLANHGVTGLVCGTLGRLCRERRRGASLLIVAEEALYPSALDQLTASLTEQPPWSDVPVLVLLRAGTATAPSIEQLRTLANLTVLERPLQIPAFVSTVHAALRVRSRQYEVRDVMAKLRDANRAKDEFLAMVSHELRTPLNVIRGMSRTLMEERADGVLVAAAAAKIDRNAAVLSRLVEDLLDFSRLQTPGFRLNIGPVDLMRVISVAVEMNRVAADAKGVRIATNLVPVAAPVVGDTLRLEQAVSNLVSNAIKYTPAEGVVTLRLCVVATHVEIVVADTGEGIAPELLPHVFEPFRQGEPGVSGGGLGLGLAIVRQLAERHGGSVEANSPGRGAGTTFTLRLPAQGVATSALTA